MTETSPRVQRVADQIQRELATLIQLEVKDPRVGMVSITGVDVSRDLSFARVFITVLNAGAGAGGNTGESEREAGAGEDSDREGSGREGSGRENSSETGPEIDENLKALAGAAGYLRTMLAKRLRLRSVPKLEFHYDSSLEKGRRLSALIDKALETERNLPLNE